MKPLEVWCLAQRLPVSSFFVLVGFLPSCFSFPDFFQVSPRLSGSRSSLTCCEIRRWCAARWVTARSDADERRRQPDIYLAADGNRFLHEWAGRRRSCRLGRLARKQRSHLLLLLLLLRCLYTLHASFVFPPHSHTRLFLSAAQPSGLWACQRLQLLWERPFFILHSAGSEWFWAVLFCWFSFSISWLMLCQESKKPKVFIVIKQINRLSPWELKPENILCFWLIN